MTINIWNRRAWSGVAATLLVAAALRLAYASWGLPSYWGDSYHHWLISRLTLENSWVYTDYKGLETIWLPAYHYLIAAVMALSGRLDMAPAQATNWALGTAACGLVAAWITALYGDWRLGVGAGLTLAALPWHVAYSDMNMPEVVAGLLLVLGVWAAQRGKAGWLGVVGCIGSLTRHELTLMFLVVGIWLAVRRQWRVAAGLAIGIALGLAGWSLWSWRLTGDALDWLIRYRWLTTVDARFWEAKGLRRAELLSLGRAAVQTFPPLVITAIAVVVGTIRRGTVQPGSTRLLAAVGGAHWLVVGLAYLSGHLPTADPRYLLVSAPVWAALGVLTLAALPAGRVRLVLAALHSILVVAGLAIQLPGFAKLPYVIQPERSAGETLAAVAPPDGTFWVDAPVAIYFSGLPPRRFRSSDLLLPAETVDPAVAARAIAGNDVRYILWDDVPYSAVRLVWPRMAEGAAFEQDGYRFEPAFRFAGWELEYGARPTILWKVEAISGQR